MEKKEEYKKNRELRKLLELTRKKCEYCGCYKKGKHKKSCPLYKDKNKRRSRISTMTEVIKKWAKRDKYLNKLERIRIKERELNTNNNKIYTGHIKNYLLNSIELKKKYD
ncbi:MAG: hypothetical protein M0R17_05975 [Candidatus Omnitrophica bacterium]|jgi:benzoyl-CoA reductase/2-hydroxyglutaryl-CoA dehydratase subunit BcrC/BadD/HgdB|nr:hypothetical protein [Candidatus Omnitrophota bacterium]